MHHVLLDNGKCQFVESFKNLNGKRKRISVVKPKYTKAIEKQAREELRLRKEEILNPKVEYQTLQFYKKEYLDYKKSVLAEKSYITYAAALNLIDDEEKVENLTKSKYQQVINKLRNTHSARSIKLHVNVLNNFFKYLKEYYIPSLEVKLQFTYSKEDKAKEIQTIKYIEPSELTEVLSKIKNNQVRNIAKVQVLTGLRIGEILALKPNDIDFKNKTLTVNRTKTQSGRITPPKTLTSIRTIEIPQTVIQILQDFISNKEFIFNVCYNTIHKQLQAAKVSSHMFRHTHVALLIEQGIPPKVISERLGHANIDTTLNIYTHVTNNMKNHLRNKLETLAPF